MVSGRMHTAAMNYGTSKAKPVPGPKSHVMKTILYLTKHSAMKIHGRKEV
jgi:predicted fused transcriptional regulator/phosphomethylpyrimidine kinase